ncbi:VTT domain-containing protein [Paraflavitalea sp. CAU 1676]|uniref:DedA family protein n=1 Tax=Paraflavitalea sp. CAU 1676 TaxID=3032598 RepID=UPI0023DCCEB6|nr:VTT domain-containing protein [Paraflavitalea sp. CAU 1676]MDF2192369.1 VTT domain-containing protein [Paraflavitalea sp. CAU 1676]
MSTWLELFHNLTNPAWIMAHGGLYIVVFIIFAETGLFAGFFLPGDTLLFIAGMIIAQTVGADAAPILHLLYWVLLIAAAAIVGNYVGYWFGKRSGEYLMKRRDTWIFKKKYLVQAQDFYTKRGGAAIIIARFLPIVRTFAPIVAGMVKMNPGKFSLFNIIGALAWSGSIVTAGFLLGENAWVQDNLDKVIIGIVVLTTAPVAIKMIAARRKKQPVPVER